MRAVAVVILFSMVAAEVCGFGMNIIAVVDYDDLLVKCTYQLVKKYFHSGESLSGSVLAISLTEVSMHLENRILQALHTDPDNFWSILVRHPKKQSESPLILREKPQAYLVVLDNLEDEDMVDVFDDWKSMPNWNPQAQFVVFLSTTEDTEEEMTEVMAETMLLFMSRKIYNINVIARTEEDGRIYSKTAFPYETENHCGTRAIAYHTLDTCDFESEESTEVYVEEHSRGLFLDKIPKDLDGCPLVAHSRSWEPYMFMENGRLKGIEWMLVQTIADSLHITIEVMIQNRTLFHIFQSLLDGEIDIVIGGIDEDPNLSHLVSASVPYLQDDLTWCVTRAKKALHWLNFLQVLSAGTYATYFIFIIANALAIQAIQSWLAVRRSIAKSLPRLVIILAGIALNQSAHTRELTSSLRICLMMSLSAALLLGSVYNSFMVSSLTSPSSLPQIKETLEIVNHHMSVTGSVDIIRHLDKEGPIFRYIRQEFLMCYNIEECLQRAAYDQNLAVAISRQHSIHNPRIPRDNLYCFDRDENIYTYLVTMLMPKKFHLFHQINPIIQYVIESGHLLKWARDLELERVLKAIRRTDSAAVESINVAQISGIFAFTAIPLVVSFLVFVTEIYVHYVYRRGTRVKLVKFLHRSFS